jgi:hypothetical protein
MMTATLPLDAPNAVAAQPALLPCRVVIRMPDGSMGRHKGLYPDALGALQRALSLFPDAQAVHVRVGKGWRAAQ